ncbi:MAG: hypothetical protein R3E89_10625 [Thiolinea sp.]
MDDKAAIARLMQATGTSILAAASSQQQALEGVVEGGRGMACSPTCCCKV